jgi:FkbM family methyltransferase
MKFTSYAQNFEDVMLWQALQDVQSGFYIDIGAWSPDLDSVTRSFYERGWSGINVEPNLDFNSELQRRRPRDQNLRLAIGDSEGSFTMNFLGNPGLSTLDYEIAKQHQQAGWSLVRQEVQVKTLATVWGQHVPNGQDVHFLKVDVEGLEEAVLRGNDWTIRRPWVVIVEATLPMSQVETHEIWEPILHNANYIFAYADGLNRFYVANEHKELLPAFRYPPNVFDDFVLNDKLNADMEAQKAEARAQQAEARAQQAEAKAQLAVAQTQRTEATARLAQTQVQLTDANAQIVRTQFLQADVARRNAEAQLHEVRASTSWRITAPLRWIVIQIKLVNQHGMTARLKALIKRVLRRSAPLINRSPGLKSICLAFAKTFGIEQRLRRIITPPQSSVPNDGPQDTVPGDQKQKQLSARSRKIYADLKSVIEENKKDN